MTPPELSASLGLSPAEAYEQALQRGFVADPAQRQAVDALQRCYRQLNMNGRGVARGVYLWGRVGRGKTWLLDRFHDSLPVPSRRQHYHHFMRWVHRRMFELTGSPDPLLLLADELAASIRVLCLDEFFVNDIGDAMILGRLVQALFDAGVVLVTTSNQAPTDLYADGFHRDRFLPAIQAIETQMEVVAVDGGEDHRLHPGERVQRYWVQDPDKGSVLPRLFDHLAASSKPSADPLQLESRRIELVKRSELVLWCRYEQLCERPLAANDYIELCDRFGHILVGEIPCLQATAAPARIARGTEDAAQRVEAGDRVLPTQSRLDDGVRRFIALVDECYDRGVPLWLEAAVPLTQLYGEAGYLAFAFRRTLSRLQEMQLARFGSGA